jgi:enoyl-CoA hydratase
MEKSVEPPEPGPSAAGCASSPNVVVRVGSGIGVIELDRPEALNALDLGMILRIAEALEGWREDRGVRAVVVRSSSPKAFCAGGDIRAVREAAVRGDEAAVLAYFSAEYALNAMIARYPKPYIALIDGYAMGGGLGISVHGSARVVTERAALAMPETGIGFFPDVGAGYFLPRLAGGVGMYLGLTGIRVSGAAAVECGLATHYVPAVELPALEAELLGGGDPAPVLNAFATAAPPSELAGHRDAIDRCFGAEVSGLGELRARLTAEDGDREWADETLAALDRASPMSLAITWRLVRDGAGSTLEECLARELELAGRTARSHDFAEGVRAALVDKDRNPSWSAM